MDYALAPGAHDQDGRARQLFQRRANTTLVDSRQIGTVHDFIAHLDGLPVASKPIDNILIASHANSSGNMEIELFRGQHGLTEYETLDATRANARQSIAVPDDLIGFDAGDPITHEVNFKGCNLGKLLPFMQRFKQVLGGHVIVSAPKHFHGLYFHDSYGVFEFMAYEFRVSKKTRFADRAAVVAAFRDGGFTLYDGTDVPAAFWDGRQSALAAPNAPFRWQANWIPRTVRHTSTSKRNVPITPALGLRKTAQAKQEFRVERNSYGPVPLRYPNAEAVPADKAAQLQVFRDNLARLPEMQADHPLPDYKRWDYATFDDFFSELDWRLEVHGSILSGTGRRYAYTVLVPVADNQTGQLIHNFYPNQNSVHAARTAGLVVTNPDFFQRV